MMEVSRGGGSRRSSGRGRRSSAMASVGNAREVPQLIDVPTGPKAADTTRLTVYGLKNSATVMTDVIHDGRDELTSARGVLKGEQKSKASDDRKDIVQAFDGLLFSQHKSAESVNVRASLAAPFIDATDGMKIVANMLPFAGNTIGVDLSNDSPSTAELVINIQHVDPDRKSDLKVESSKWTKIQVDDHLITGLVESMIKRRLKKKPTVLWKEIHISNVCQRLLHGGGSVAFAAVIKSAARQRETPEGAMNGNFEHDKAVFERCKERESYQSLLRLVNRLDGDEKALASSVNEIEELKKKLAELNSKDQKNPELSKIKARSLTEQIRAHERIKQALEKTIEEDQRKRGTPDSPEVANYFMNEKTRTEINKSIKAMMLTRKAANKKAAQEGRAVAEYFLEALKERAPKIHDGCRECAHPMCLFSTDAMKTVHNQGKSDYIPVAEAFALVDFDHELHIEFQAHTEKHGADSSEYKRIRRVMPDNGKFMMPDPRFVEHWYKMEDVKTDKLRPDPLGYAMALCAPVVLYKEFKNEMKGKEEKERNDTAWKEFVSKKYDSKTGMLSLDRELFYQHVDELARLSTLYDSITRLDRLELRLMPAGNAVIKRNVDENGMPIGERGYFSCKLHLKVQFLDLDPNTDIPNMKEYERAWGGATNAVKLNPSMPTGASK